MDRFEVYDDAIDAIRQFLPTLQIIEFNSCYFSSEQSPINIFPIQCAKLNALILTVANTGYSEEDSLKLFTLNQHFPFLQHITLTNAHIVNTCDFFKKNQQLATFTDNTCDNQILQYVFENLPRIQSLKLQFPGERTIILDNINCLQELNSLSMASDVFELTAIVSNNSLSLQNLCLRNFNVSYATTDITKFINLKTLQLKLCTLRIDYFIEICKRCNEMSEIYIDIPPEFTAEHLIQIIRFATKLQKLVLPNCNSFPTVSYQTFSTLVEIVKYRHSKISILIGTPNEDRIITTLTDHNILLQYTSYAAHN